MYRCKLLSIPVLLVFLVSCVTTNTPTGIGESHASPERTNGCFEMVFT